MSKVMYIVVNKDLGMSAGKVGAHTAHAVYDYLYRMIWDRKDYVDDSKSYQKLLKETDQFKLGGDTIIILEAHEKDMLKWEKKGFVAVRDRGLTEIEANSLTAINLGVYDKDLDEVPKWIQRIRVYKES